MGQYSIESKYSIERNSKTFVASLASVSIYFYDKNIKEIIALLNEQGSRFAFRDVGLLKMNAALQFSAGVFVTCFAEYLSAPS